MRDLKLVVVLVSILAGIVACSGPVPNNSTTNSGNNAAANSKADVATIPGANNSNSPATAQPDGKEIYTESCKICHQETGKGGPTTVNGKKIKPADLTAGHSKKHSDEDLAKDISEGSPEDGMPAFKSKLTPEEIKAVVGYIRILQQQ